MQHPERLGVVCENRSEPVERKHLVDFIPMVGAADKLV
jgi:hypothetical protein